MRSLLKTALLLLMAAVLAATTAVAAPVGMCGGHPEGTRQAAVTASLDQPALASYILHVHGTHKSDGCKACIHPCCLTGSMALLDGAPSTLSLEISPASFAPERERFLAGLTVPPSLGPPKLALI
jgi:hypothetical protein